VDALPQLDPALLDHPEEGGDGLAGFEDVLLRLVELDAAAAGE